MWQSISEAEGFNEKDDSIELSTASALRYSSVDNKRYIKLYAKIYSTMYPTKMIA